MLVAHACQEPISLDCKLHAHRKCTQYSPNVKLSCDARLDAFHKALEQHRQKQSLEAFDNIIRALAKRDKQIAGVFMNPVDTKEFDSYLDIVKHPICIKDIMCASTHHLKTSASFPTARVFCPWNGIKMSCRCQNGSFPLGL